MIYVFLADGFEEIEAVTSIDILRRAGLDVVTVGVTGNPVKGSHNISVLADIDVNDIVYEGMEAIVLPGGFKGTQNMEKSIHVQNCIDYCTEKNILICAICAAPFILGHKGLLTGKKAVCFPDFEKDLLGAQLSAESVCADSNYITAKGAGVAIDFALAIVEHFYGKSKSQELRSVIQCP